MNEMVPNPVLSFETLASDESLQGGMNDPTGSAAVTGACGDSMEFYLFIRNGIIEDAKYCTDGCEITRACAALVAKSATGQSIQEALGISPKQIIDQLPPLPYEHRHCPILAVGTFYQAIADYMLKP